jgi:hypothetical protein
LVFQCQRSQNKEPENRSAEVIIFENNFRKKEYIFCGNENVGLMFLAFKIDIRLSGYIRLTLGFLNAGFDVV